MKVISALAALLLAAIPILFPGPARAQEPDSIAAETRAEVPSLDRFHEVIRTMWHDAWPEKDAAALRALLPEIRHRAAEVEAAELPGILRDKRPAWERDVKDLKALVADYASAAAGSEDQALLDAAERLHAQFERLVRIIRPALPELEAFHVVLYQLYHYDLESGDPGAIRATAERLHEPLAALNRAELPERLSRRAAAFLAAREELTKAVDRLDRSLRSDDEERLKKAVLDVHDRYQALAAVFD